MEEALHLTAAFSVYDDAAATTTQMHVGPPMTPTAHPAAVY